MIGRRIITEKIETPITDEEMEKIGFQKRWQHSSSIIVAYISNEVNLLVEWDGYVIIRFNNFDKYYGIDKRDLCSIETLKYLLKRHNVFKITKYTPEIEIKNMNLVQKIFRKIIEKIF